MEHEIRHGEGFLVVHPGLVVVPVAQHVAGGMEQDHPKDRKDEIDVWERPGGQHAAAEKPSESGKYRHHRHRERPVAGHGDPFFEGVSHGAKITYPGVFFDNLQPFSVYLRLINLN